MNEQEVFDKVADHLMKQGKRAFGIRRAALSGGGEHASVGCCYRTADGLRCAVGCLIADEDYDPLMEGHSAESLVTQFSAKRPSLAPLVTHKDLLQSLQREAHDKIRVGPFDASFRDQCIAGLRVVAQIYDLKCSL